MRYALEEARYGYDKWSKWDVLHLVRFLLQNGAKPSINQAGNSAIACVFRHLRDWEVCYELLNMLIKEDGEGAADRAAAATLFIIFYSISLLYCY